SLRNKLALLDRLEAFFKTGNLPLGKAEDASELPSPEALQEGVQRALALLGQVRQRWSFLHQQIDTPLQVATPHLIALGYQQALGTAEAQPGDTVFNLLQTWSIRVSWKKQLRDELSRIFNGSTLAPVVDECKRIHKEVLRGRVWVALHMHAGDGNVHTNIPVNSDNYEMLQTAHEAVARIMKLARSLDGVISGEHGIGITKLEFLTDDEIAAFTDYKRRVDPEGRFNKGKLLRDATLTGGVKADLTNAYTPSFGLMGHESLIMQQSD